MTDPLSHVRQTAFDALNRVITETDPLSHTVQYALDGRDNLTQLTDGRSLATTREVDGFNEVIQEVSPDRGTSSYYYDANGRLTERVDGDSVETDFAYDAVNRLTAMTFPAASAENVAYTYDQTSGGNDGIGRLTNVTEESGSTSLTYDAQGRVITDAKVINGKSFSVAYAYDANGRVTQISYPSGRTVNFTRTTDGLITAVTTTPSGGSAQNVATSVAYEPFGPLASLAYGNSYALTLTYDENYWLDRIQVVDGSTTAFDLSFAHNTDGRFANVTDNAATGRGATITYTNAGQLASAAGPWGSETYTYDAAYNRTSDDLTIGGTTTTNNEVMASGSNQLASVEDASSTVKRSFTWNTGGDMATDATVGGDTYAYTYDYRKRLASVAKNGTGVGVYAYDYLGQRVARAVTSGASTDYVFDRDGRLLAEHDASTGNVLKEYIWVDDTPVAVVDSTSGTATVYYVTPGHLNEPEQLLNGSGTKVWDAFVNPWGWAQTFSTASASINLRLPGQWLTLEANGLNQNHFRDYNPSTGRYVEADPLGIAAGQNVYGYAIEDPDDLDDPLGLWPPGISVKGGTYFGHQVPSEASSVSEITANLMKQKVCKTSALAHQIAEDIVNKINWPEVPLLMQLDDSMNNNAPLNASQRVQIRNFIHGLPAQDQQPLLQVLKNIPSPQKSHN